MSPLSLIRPIVLLVRLREDPLGDHHRLTLNVPHRLAGRSQMFGRLLSLTFGFENFRKIEITKSLLAGPAGPQIVPVSYTHLTLPTNREV